MIAVQTSLVAQMVKRLSTMRQTRVRSWVGKIPWRRKWQSTPVLLPGKSHGQGSRVGYSPWGRKESDTTERLHFASLSLCWQVRGDIMWLWFAFPWWLVMFSSHLFPSLVITLLAVWTHPLFQPHYFIPSPSELICLSFPQSLLSYCSISKLLSSGLILWP